MPLLDKKFNVLSNLFLFTDMTGTFLNTTLAAAALKNATTITVAAGTNSTNGDDIRIGTGETMELARIASGGGTTSLTLSKPLKFDHANGEAVVEQQALNLGVPEADGVRFRYNGETTDVFSAVARLAYGVITGYVDLGLAWRFPALSADVLAFSLGIPRANVIGDGTAAAQTGTVGPRLFTTDGALFGALTNVNAVLTGTLQDGSFFRLDAYNITIDPTAFNVTLARGTAVQVPIRTLCSSAAADYTQAAFVPANVVNTFSTSKADMFSEITGAYILTDSGTATTANGAITANAYSITVASATGIVAGDVVRVGSGDNAEFHMVHSVVTNTLNLRTQVLRAFATGVPVVKQTLNNYGIAQGGFTMAASGSVETQRSELSRVSLGYRAQNVAVTFSFNLDAIRPETLYYALGIPASEYNVGGSLVLPINGNIAKATTATIMFVGLTQGGKTITAIGWNGAAQIGGETQFTQAATAQFPIQYKPNGLNLWVNT